MCECVSVLAIRCDDADDGKLHYRSFGKQLRCTVGVGRWENPDSTDRYLQYVQWESSRMKLLEEWSICCFLSSQARSTPGKSRFLFFFTGDHVHEMRQRENTSRSQCNYVLFRSRKKGFFHCIGGNIFFYKSVHGPSR